MGPTSAGPSIFFLGYVYQTCQKWALTKLIKGNVEFIKQPQTLPLLCQELVEGKLVAGCVPIYDKTENMWHKYNRRKAQTKRKH